MKSTAVADSAKICDSFAHFWLQFFGPSQIKKNLKADCTDWFFFSFCPQPRLTPAPIRPCIWRTCGTRGHKGWTQGTQDNGTTSGASLSSLSSRLFCFHSMLVCLLFSSRSLFPVSRLEGRENLSKWPNWLKQLNQRAGFVSAAHYPENSFIFWRIKFSGWAIHAVLVTVVGDFSGWSVFSFSTQNHGIGVASGN